LQNSEVRRSCQTIALESGWAVSLFHKAVVSLWFVIPILKISWEFIFAFLTASRAVSMTVQ